MKRRVSRRKKREILSSVTDNQSRDTCQFDDDAIGCDDDQGTALEIDMHTVFYKWK